VGDGLILYAEAGREDDATCNGIPKRAEALGGRRAADLRYHVASSHFAARFRIFFHFYRNGQSRRTRALSCPEY
jgi:hypothetical protein